MLLGSLDACQRAEWIWWIQIISRHVQRGVCFCRKTPARKTPNWQISACILAWTNSLPIKRENRRTNTVSGWCFCPCWFSVVLPCAGLSLYVQTLCVMLLHWAVNHAGAILNPSAHLFFEPLSADAALRQALMNSTVLFFDTICKTRWADCPNPYFSAALILIRSFR